MNLIKTPFGFRSTGAEVTLAVRDVAPLDLTDPDSVAAFNAAWDGPLHILVANVGVMATPERYTQQGWEWHDALDPEGAERLWPLSETLLAKGIA
ncbi:hypothetical protein [Amycolatopsis lexingtonensis]|uniref:hypothetical protein n=1 Tax=Amycolatopsis lexingtonensis TaxID=218822 RepID=UPI003F71A3CB